LSVKDEIAEYGVDPLERPCDDMEDGDIVVPETNCSLDIAKIAELKRIVSVIPRSDPWDAYPFKMVVEAFYRLKSETQ